MQVRLKAFLEEVAHRGSWMGGGSVAALSAALSAALLEKLITQPRTTSRLRRIRSECVQLIEQDAAVFSKVIEATREGSHAAFSHALKAATDVPYRIFVHARTVILLGRKVERSVKPQLQSDLRCVLAVAKAAGESACALIDTNLKWLNDPAYSKRMRQRLRAL